MSDNQTPKGRSDDTKFVSDDPKVTPENSNTTLTLNEPLNKYMENLTSQNDIKRELIKLKAEARTALREFYSNVKQYDKTHEIYFENCSPEECIENEDYSGLSQRLRVSKFVTFTEGEEVLRKGRDLAYRFMEATDGSLVDYLEGRFPGLKEEMETIYEVSGRENQVPDEDLREELTEPFRRLADLKESYTEQLTLLKEENASQKEMLKHTKEVLSLTNSAGGMARKMKKTVYEEVEE